MYIFLPNQDKSPQFHNPFSGEGPAYLSMPLGIGGLFVLIFFFFGLDLEIQRNGYFATFTCISF